MRKDFQTVLGEQLARYPRMQLQDCAKLAYQNALGPAHAAPDRERFFKELLTDFGAVPVSGKPQPLEQIGNGLCRFHLVGTDDLPMAVPLLTELFFLTAERRWGTRRNLEQNLTVLEALDMPQMADWLAEYRRRGCPPVHHTRIYREAYHPRYRLLATAYGGFFPALLRVAELVRQGAPAVVAVDGRCGSGKTSLSALIQKLFPCNVIHMDDFYLPPKKRKANWQEIPGGNMDLARLQKQVLTPAAVGDPVYYRAFDCRSGHPGDAFFLPACPLTVVEGSYSQHPQISSQYALRIFLTCSSEEQRRRLREREGEHFASYESRWIPLEEQYFRLCTPQEKSDCVIDTTDFFS